MLTVDQEDDMKTPRLALYAGLPVRLGVAEGCNHKMTHEMLTKH